MIRFSRLFTALALAGSLVVVTAIAASPVAPSQADVVRSVGDCIFFDANGAPVVDPAARIQIVYTNNDSGVYNATCVGQLPDGAPLPTSAQHWDFDNTGYTCLAGADWKGTTSPSGEARFICHGKI